MVLYLLPLMVSGVGVYFLIKLRFFFIVHPIKTLRMTIRGLKSHNCAASLSLALAGTLGVGNVFGVASGIIIGGVGSVFWLFVCTVFCSVIKYAEVTLVHDNANRDRISHGGMAYCIKRAFGKYGRVPAAAYAVLTVLLSLAMGAGLQCGAFVGVVGEICTATPLSVSIFFTLFVVLAIAGGGRKIEKITAIMIPLSTIIYIIMTITIILLNFEKLPGVIKTVLDAALEPYGALGGGVAFAFLLPIKEGYCRGVLSNEAGCGTSGTAHIKSGILNPALAGLMGIAEVSFDTSIMCMLTAFSILVSVPDLASFTSPMALIASAFSYNFGYYSVYVLLGLIFVFAYSTVICWYYYAEQALLFLGLSGYKSSFFCIYIAAVALLSLIGDSKLLHVTDLILLLMSTLTMIVLIKSSDRIKRLSESGGVIKKRDTPPVYKVKLKKSDS